jgi:hypothetical protein
MRDLQQIQFARTGNCLGPVFHIQFIEDIGGMSFNSCHRDGQMAGYLFVRPPLCDQTKQFDFTPGEYFRFYFLKGGEII